MRNDVILNKSKAFALRIIKVYQYLTDEKRDNGKVESRSSEFGSIFN